MGMHVGPVVQGTRHVGARVGARQRHRTNPVLKGKQMMKVKDGFNDRKVLTLDTEKMPAGAHIAISTTKHGGILIMELGRGELEMLHAATAEALLQLDLDQKAEK
jgi:hypothetical protein